MSATDPRQLAEQATLPPTRVVEVSATLSPEQAAAQDAGARREVPGYEILEELGRGGMGVVYKARQKGLKRLVALKMILGGGHAGSTDLDRFRREAEALARLQHPNVVQIYEVDEVDGCPFFSMEYCAAGSLAQLLAGTPLVPTQAAEWLEVLARTMHAAHQAGIVHRDLKPANVLLSPRTSSPLALEEEHASLSLHDLKITDFGLAKKTGESDGPTQSGSILGTPSYMAPEQAGGLIKEQGPSVDVYALGALLYECLTGRPPFRAASPLDTIFQVLHDDPAPPRQLNPTLSRDLETICLKCLHKDPRKRYGSALALAEDLHRYRQGIPILARPGGLIERAIRWMRRRPTQAALVVSCLLLVAVGLAGILWNWRASALARAREAEHLQKTEAALERARRLLYLNALSRAEEAWRDSNTIEARRLLERVPQDLRGWEWHYARRLYQGDLFTLQGHTDSVTSVACAATRLATGSADRTVLLWDAITGKLERRLRGHQQSVTSVAFSAEGRWVASASRDGNIFIWDANSGKQIRKLAGHPSAVLAVTFAADGTRLASGGEDRVARIWDAQTGNMLLTLSGHDHFVTGVAFHPTRPWLATSCADNIVRVWDLEAPARQLMLRGHTSEVRAVAFSPDGKLLASASWDKRIKLWDPVTGSLLRDLDGHTQGAYSVAFSPNGKLLASASGDRTARLWEVETAKTLAIVPGHSHYVTSVAFSPDSGRLVVARNDQTVKVWDLTQRRPTVVLRSEVQENDRLRFDSAGDHLALWRNAHPLRTWNVHTGQESSMTTTGWEEGNNPPFKIEEGDKAHITLDEETLVLESRDARILSITVSPDGTRLATGCDDRSVRLWDSRSGHLMLTMRGHGASVTAITFSPDGHRLASLDRDGEVRIWNATPLE